MAEYQDPLEFLRDIMNNPNIGLQTRMKAALALAQHTAPTRQKEIIYRGRDAARLADVEDVQDVFVNAMIAPPKITANREEQHGADD